MGLGRLGFMDMLLCRPTHLDKRDCQVCRLEPALFERLCFILLGIFCRLLGVIGMPFKVPCCLATVVAIFCHCAASMVSAVSMDSSLS